MSYDILLKNAVALHQAGRLDEAENEYRRLLESTPDNPDLLYLLGLVAVQRGAFDAAVSHLFAAVRLSPETVPYRFTLAQALFAAGHPHEALEHYGEVVRRDPSLPDAYNNIGSIRQSLNEPEKAQEYYDKALQVDPSFMPAYINSGVLKRSLGQTDEALALFDKAIALCPDEPDGYAQKALTLRETGRFAEALTHYDEALKKNPDNPVVVNGRGVALELSGRLDDALAAYNRALELAPRFADAYNNRANVYAKQGKKWDAEDDYKKAISIDRKYVQAMTNLGALLFQNERYEEALEYYRKAFLIDPKQPQALNNLAMAVKMSGDYEEAVGLFFDALVQDPTLKTVHHNLAVALFELYTKQNRPDEAKKLAEKWAKSYPDNIVARHLCDAFSGKIPESGETAYLTELFDAFADTFDATLDALDYRLPLIVKNALTNLFPSGQKAASVLDAGCGTGLCAKALRAFSETLTGVDLSERMLEKAENRHVYDTLTKADLLTFLPGHENAFDLIVAADVVCYMGDLSEIAEKTFNALRSGGFFLFSVEKSDKKSDFEFCPTGRFRHKKEYVSNVLTKTGFDVLSVSEETLRNENSKSVEGCFFVARKKEMLDKTARNALFFKRCQYGVAISLGGRFSRRRSFSCRKIKRRDDDENFKRGKDPRFAGRSAVLHAHETGSGDDLHHHAARDDALFGRRRGARLDGRPHERHQRPDFQNKRRRGTGFEQRHRRRVSGVRFGRNPVGGRRSASGRTGRRRNVHQNPDTRRTQNRDAPDTAGESRRNRGRICGRRRRFVRGRRFQHRTGRQKRRNVRYRQGRETG